MKNGDKNEAALSEARDQFISQWGVIGSAWGVNRTMAQIHALLITAPSALSTDDIMQELKISRGNAHSNLRDLVSWGLVRSVVRKGERKEFFEAEKNVWKMFCIIIRERRRRELRPAQIVLKDCLSRTGNLRGAELEDFIRDAAETYYHQTCTAKMGRDSMSVVDAKLKVYGIENLRIADGSIMPRVTTGNTMAPCVIIGERAAHILRIEHKL